MVFCCFIGLSGRDWKKTAFFMQIFGGFLLKSNFWIFAVLWLSANNLNKNPKNAPLLRSRRPSLESRQFRAPCPKKTIQSKNHARRARFAAAKKPRARLIRAQQKKTGIGARLYSVLFRHPKPKVKQLQNPVVCS